MKIKQAQKIIKWKIGTKNGCRAFDPIIDFANNANFLICFYFLFSQYGTISASTTFSSTIKYTVVIVVVHFGNLRNKQPEPNEK